jgi:hypothetical protein
MRLEATEPVVRQVTARFKGQADESLPPEVAFDVRARCPVLRGVAVEPIGPGVWQATVSGTGLAEVVRVGAALPDGKLAEAHLRRDAEGLSFPIACTDCEVYLGVASGEHVGGCLGPGYSFRMDGGRLTAG